MPIDLTKYDPSDLSETDVRSLVESMYTALDANERISELFAESDRRFSIRCLESLLDDSNLETVCNAAETLVFLEREKSIPRLAKLLEHEDEGVRGAACRFLSRLPSSEGEALLVKKLQEDASSNVRYIAADALGSIGDAVAVEALRQIIDTDTGRNFEGRSVSGCAQGAIQEITKRQGRRLRP